MLTYLVDADRELAERLLDDRAITNEELLEVIAGQRNEVTEQIGSLLLDRGVAPELIAAAAGISHDVRNDPKSHEQALEYFKALGERVPALLPVAEAGCAQQETLRG
jgi:non-ribosomal peptide synthetase component F